MSFFKRNETRFVIDVISKTEENTAARTITIGSPAKKANISSETEAIHVSNKNVSVNCGLFLIKKRKTKVEIHKSSDITRTAMAISLPAII